MQPLLARVHRNGAVESRRPVAGKPHETASGKMQNRVYFQCFAGEITD
jgi:hypothetical protein